jgi:N-acetylmuramoyl-L-alanine amidase
MIKLSLKSTLLALTLVLVSSNAAYAAPYQVKSGDTLFKISNAYNTTTNVLVKNNGLSNYNIYPGQVLDVPANTYKVVSGDTLYLISKKFNISLDKVRIANNKWNNTIYPGQILNIPIISTGGQATLQKTPGVIAYSASDVDLLARLITAESGGEGYNAMLSVGAVVVNRVQNPLFPSNISGVINEVSAGYYQFTPVMNGTIKNLASQSAINAAYEVLKGADPTKGALYFYDNTVTNKWLTSKPVAASFGSMTFAYR